MQFSGQIELTNQILIGQCIKDLSATQSDAAAGATTTPQINQWLVEQGKVIAYAARAART